MLGGQVREYAVDVEPDRLLAHGITLADVRDAIARTNEINSVGRLEQDYRLYLVIATGQFPDASAIGRTVMKSVDGTPITVADVARVDRRSSRNGYGSRRTVSQPSWSTCISSATRAPSSIAHGIQEVLTAYRAKLPPDVSLAAYYDQSELIVSSVHNVRDSIVVGIVLGIMVLFGFLDTGA